MFRPKKEKFIKLGDKQSPMFHPLQWISTHFGRAGSETSWELGNYVPEFAVSLLLEPIKLRTLK